MLFPAESKSFSSQLSILSLCDRHTRRMLCHGTNTAQSLLHKTAGENEELTQSRWSLTPVKIMCVIEFFLLFLLASHSIYSLCWLLPDVLRKGRRRATTTQIYSLNMASWKKKKSSRRSHSISISSLTLFIDSFIILTRMRCGDLLLLRRSSLATYLPNTQAARQHPMIDDEISAIDRHTLEIAGCWLLNDKRQRIEISLQFQQQLNLTREGLGGSWLGHLAVVCRCWTDQIYLS